MYDIDKNLIKRITNCKDQKQINGWRS